MKHDWNPYDRKGKLPPQKRLVLLRMEDKELGKSVLAVGFLTPPIGSVAPFFVCPGLESTRLKHPTHWCDCLGDDFEAPHWDNEETLLTQALMLE